MKYSKQKVMLGNIHAGYFIFYRRVFSCSVIKSVEGLYKIRKFRPHVSPTKIKRRLRLIWKNSGWRHEE